MDFLKASVREVADGRRSISPVDIIGWGFSLQLAIKSDVDVLSRLAITVYISSNSGDSSIKSSEPTK